MYFKDFFMISQSPELNVDQAITILVDFKASRDMFYACRWVSPRLIKQNLMTRGGN